MPFPTPVRVEAVIERPLPLPWVVAELPFPERVESWPGMLLAGRWLDKYAGLWTGLVRYEREGLLYEHWMSGDLIRPVDQPDQVAAPVPCCGHPCPPPRDQGILWLRHLL